MKRVIAILFLAGLLTGAVGCGGSKEDKAPKLQGDPDPKVQGPAGAGSGGKDKKLTPAVD